MQEMKKNKANQWKFEEQQWKFKETRWKIKENRRKSQKIIENLSKSKNTQEKIRKSNKYSILDSVKGIGPITKKALLKEFKSLKGIKEAPKDDLMTIKNINETMASEIKQKLWLLKYLMP